MDIDQEGELVTGKDQSQQIILPGMAGVGPVAIIMVVTYDGETKSCADWAMTATGVF